MTSPTVALQRLQRLQPRPLSTTTQSTAGERAGPLLVGPLWSAVARCAQSPGDGEQHAPPPGPPSCASRRGLHAPLATTSAHLPHPPHPHPVVCPGVAGGVAHIPGRIKTASVLFPGCCSSSLSPRSPPALSLLCFARCQASYPPLRSTTLQPLFRSLVSRRAPFPSLLVTGGSRQTCLSTSSLRPIFTSPRTRPASPFANQLPLVPCMPPHLSFYSPSLPCRPLLVARRGTPSLLCSNGGHDAAVIVAPRGCLSPSLRERYVLF